MPLSTSLKNEITAFLKKKLIEKIERYDLNAEDAGKPFQYAIFTTKSYLVKGFIHGCETALGTWHESIAKMIAKDNFKVAKRLAGKNKLKGHLVAKAQDIFSNILSDLDSVIREPNHMEELKEIYATCQIKEEHTHLLERQHTIDLYLERENGEEIYFEIKGPKPNKNEMRATKRNLLEIFAMRATKGKKVNVLLGMYYNPYTPKEYNRWTCLKFFDKGNDLLVGKDFWDFLGGVGTYETLIQIYEQVGEEIRPTLNRKFKSLIDEKINTKN